MVFVFFFVVDAAREGRREDVSHDVVRHLNNLVAEVDVPAPADVDDAEISTGS